MDLTVAITIVLKTCKVLRWYAVRRQRTRVHASLGFGLKHFFFSVGSQALCGAETIILSFCFFLDRVLGPMGKWFFLSCLDSNVSFHHDNCFSP